MVRFCFVFLPRQQIYLLVLAITFAYILVDCVDWRCYFIFSVLVGASWCVDNLCKKRHSCHAKTFNYFLFRTTIKIIFWHTKTMTEILTLYESSWSDESMQVFTCSMFYSGKNRLLFCHSNSPSVNSAHSCGHIAATRRALFWYLSIFP